MNARVSVPAPAMAPRRSPWPWAIALGLGAGVAANLWMVSIAVRNGSVPVPGDIQHELVAYEEVAQAHRAAAALGWRVDLDRCVPEATTDAAAACRMAVHVTDESGHAVTGLHGSIVARRGDDAAFDREAQLVARDGGDYEVVLPLVRGGLYRLDVALQGGAAPWLGTRELLARESGTP